MKSVSIKAAPNECQGMRFGSAWIIRFADSVYLFVEESADHSQKKFS
jgi:hypothetical protein